MIRQAWRLSFTKRPPGQGLVRDPHAVALRKITEPAELAGEELIIVDGDQDALDAPIWMLADVGSRAGVQPSH